MNEAKKRKYGESGLPNFGQNDNAFMPRKRTNMDSQSEQLEGIRPPINSGMFSGMPIHQQEALLMQNNESQESRDKLLGNLLPKASMLLDAEGVEKANGLYQKTELQDAK